MDGHPPLGEPFEEVESLRRQLQRERDLTVRLLRLANSPKDLHGLMGEASRLIQEWSDCSAVGIRLRDGDDFPYFETRGFPTEFIQAENSLCVHNLDGQLARDSQDNPVLECMCGNILCGRFNPALPFFTPGGSFWTNSTSQLLASTTEADRQARTRNRCNGEGYESVALIPLRADGNTFGLLQLNDHRTGRFNAELIAILEDLAAALAEAIARRLAVQELRLSRERLNVETQKLRDSERHLRGLLDAVDQSVMLLELDGTILDCNQTFVSRLGRTREDLLGRDVYSLLPPEIAQQRRLHVEEARHSRSPVSFADERWGRRFSHRIVPILDDQDQVVRFATQGADITEESRLTQDLQTSNQLLEAVRNAQALFIAEQDPKTVFARLLEILVKASESEYGFLDEVVRSDDGTVFKRNLAMSDISWDEDSRRLYEQLASSNFVFPNLENLAGAPVVSGQVVIANDPAHDHQSQGVPPGHPPLNSFLGIPLYYGGQLVGVAGVANRTGGYTQEIANFLEPLSASCAGMIAAQRTKMNAEEARDSLRRSQTELRAVYDNSPVMMCVLDADRHLLTMNHTMAEFIGKREDELRGQRACGIIGCVNALEDPRGCGYGRKCESCTLRHASNETLQTGKPHRMIERRMTIVGDDGPREIVLLASTALIETEAGTNLLISIEDVTEQRKAEDRLRLQAMVLDQITDRVTVTDLEGRITYVNDAQCRGFNCSREDLIGKSVESFGDDSQRGATQREIIETTLRNGHWQGEAVNFDASGEESTLDCRTHLVVDSSGHSVAMCGVATDITQRKRIEQTLREAHQLRDTILQHTNVMAVYLDNTFNFVWVNQAYADACKHDPDFFRGKNHFDLYPHAENQAIFQRVVDTGKPFTVTAKPFVFPDQLERGITYWDWSLVPVKDPAGGTIGLVFTLMNVTEQKKIAKERAAAHRTLEAIWSIASVADTDLKSTFDHVVTTLVHLTESPFSFFGLLNEDESVMTIHAWSGDAMDSCSIQDRPFQFPIAEAGIWGEAVRQRKSLVLNNYSANHPAKKGYPDGHVALTRLVVVPLVSHGKILSVAAVANRQAEYSEDDVAQISAFMNGIQSVIERRQAEEALQESERRLKEMATNIPGAVYQFIRHPDRTYEFPFMSEGGVCLLGTSREGLQNPRGLIDKVYPDDRKDFRASVEESATALNPWRHEFRIIGKDGEQKWIRGASMPSALPDGSICWNGVLLDITDARQAEQALRESEARYRLLIENSLFPVVVTSLVNNTILFANSCAEDYFGISQGTAIGMAAPDFWCDRAVRDRLVARLLQGEQIQSEEVRLRTRAGEVRCVLISSTTIEFKGTPAAFSVLSDISERVWAEEALRESERRFRSLFDNPIVAVALHEIILDDQGNPIDYVFLQTNAAFEAQTGLMASEILGKRVTQIFPAEEVASLIATYGNVALTGEPVGLEAYSATLGRHFSISAYRVRLGCFATVFLDTTQRKKMEDALRDNEALLSQAEEIVGMGSFIWDVESDRFSSSSGMHRLYGLSEREFPNSFRSALLQLVHPHDQHRIRAEADRMVAERRAWTVEFDIVRSDGQERLIHCESQAVLGTDGRVIRYVGTLQDITRHRRDAIRFDTMQQQLHHTSRLAVMGELAAGIAHEVNQPLCSIVNFAKACQNLASREPVDLEKICQWTEAIGTAAGRAGDIVRRLLGFARRYESDRETVQVGRMIDDAILLIHHEARSQQVTLKVNIPGDDPAVHVQPVRIQQVLVNLLRNAIEAFPMAASREKLVVVSVQRLPDGVRISVADNGAGLSESDLQRLFEPFFTTKPQGLGLGLAISRTIIEDHGGQIQATPTPDGGLTFRFTLPVGEDTLHDACG